MADSIRAGTHLTIICKTSGMADTVQFYNNDSPREICFFIPNAEKRICYSEDPRNQISQNISAKQTVLRISDVSLERDRGRWQCSYGTRKGPPKYLKVYGKSVDAFSFEFDNVVAMSCTMFICNFKQ